MLRWTSSAAGRILLVAAALLTLVAWRSFAPRMLGGQTTYVTTVGSSMEPLLHRGDLVLVRPASRYEAGDVVAYRSRELRTIVLHRIVRRDGERFVLQGDNNNWLDAERPLERDVVGKMAMKLPGFGRRMAQVRSPLGLSVLAGLAAGVAGGGRRLRRRSREKPRAAPVRMPGGPRVLAGIAGVLVLGGAVVFTRPTTQSAQKEVTYEHAGSFTYVADAGPGADIVYGKGSASSGEPVYRRLSSRVRVAFAYTFETPAQASAKGTIALSVRISDGDGWSRTFPLTPKTPFVGTQTAIDGTIDLPTVAAVTTEVGRLTGITKDHYAVAVLAEIDVDAHVAGEHLHEQFAPTLPFRFDELMLRLNSDSGDVLHPAKGGSVPRSVDEPARLSFAGLGVTVAAARVLLLGVALVMILGVVAFGIRILPEKDETARAVARLGDAVIPVSGRGRTVRDAVDVGTLAALVRLAEQHERLVLRETVGGATAYYVEDSGITYRYVAGSSNSNGNGKGNGRRPRPLVAEGRPRRTSS